MSLKISPSTCNCILIIESPFTENSKIIDIIQKCKIHNVLVGDTVKPIIDRCIKARTDIGLPKNGTLTDADIKKEIDQQKILKDASK